MTYNAVKLYKYSNRDLVLGYNDWYSLEERTIDPYRQDYEGVAEYILPDGVEVVTIYDNTTPALIETATRNILDIYPHNSGRPQIWGMANGKAPVLNFA